MVKTETWRPGESVVFSALDGGIALLDTERNVYYTLRGIGPFLWEQLAQGRSFTELCRAVEDRYDVSFDTASSDIADWLGEMTASGLIVEQHD
jgi:hypothetical protein